MVGPSFGQTHAALISGTVFVDQNGDGKMDGTDADAAADVRVYIDSNGDGKYETAHFSGLPIADLPVEQRACGVWVVDLRSGQTVAFLRFDAGVQEIFAVQVLPRRCPELIDDPKLAADTFVLPDAALADTVLRRP